MEKAKKKHNYYFLNKSKNNKSRHLGGDIDNNQQSKLGLITWIVLILFLILWIIDLLKGGVYGYDYYPFRNLYK